MFNKKRCTLGANLVEYILPAALLGLVIGLGVYKMYQDGSIANYIIASMGDNIVADGSSSAITTTVAEDANEETNEEADPEEETEPTATMDCGSGSCTIHFGAYTLNGVPESFKDSALGSASNASNISDQLAVYLKDIIDQMVAAGEPEEVTDPLSRLAIKFGLDPDDVGLGSEPEYMNFSQFAGYQYALEYLVSGNDPDGRISLSGVVDGVSVYQDSRTGRQFSDSLLDLNGVDGVMDKLDQVNGDVDDRLATFLSACDTAASLNGKDYEPVKGLISYLASQGKDINAQFVDQITDSGEVTTLDLNIDDIKANVASSMEDFTAASIVAAANGG
ncbi:MAG: hypothetical protein AB1782_15235 [Cyanobacteriota bacterium]